MVSLKSPLIIPKYIDCEKNAEDPQCKHEVLKDSPITGAGHHVRAKTDTPIIGILTQPIPSTVHGDSIIWDT
jgi:hypothetical protein